MHKVPGDTRALVARQDVDEIVPSCAVSGEPAKLHQLAGLVAIANREIPGINSTKAALAAFLREEPESIFAFERYGRLQGGIAFLYLNCRGHDALLLDDIDLKNPRREFLTRPDEEVSAIYVWALAGHGRAVIGLGNVAAYLRRPRFINADYFALPATAAGRDLLLALGFERTPTFQQELWGYQRPWNHVPAHIPASPIPAT